MLHTTLSHRRFSALVAKLFVFLWGTSLAFNVYAQEVINTTSSGIADDGYSYYFWNDGFGPASMTLNPNGNFTAEWDGVGNFFAGKGWETGGRRTVEYTVNSFTPGGNSWIGILGFTVDPYREYYIVDNWGTWRPNAGTAVGTVTTDGGTYDIYKRFVARPDLYYDIYWSVRREKRPEGGTITTGNHFDAWADLGMELDNFRNMVVMVEGYQSSGSADITVGELPSPSCDICNWYGWHLPICKGRDEGWGWENHKNCIGIVTCDSQWGFGGPICQ